MKAPSLKLSILALLAMLALPCIPNLHAAPEPEGPPQKYDPENQAVTEAPILVQRARGDVRAMSERYGSSFELKDGAKISQGTTILTGKDSRVSLIFSNGAVVGLDSNSRIKINRFEQAGGMDMDLTPLVRDGKSVEGTRARPMGTYDKEPTYSHTSIYLVEGVAYARVKKLNRKSTYQLRTPLGSTQVLGTAWRQTNHTNPAKLETISTVELHSGSVQFEPINNDSSSKPIRIRPGQKLTIIGTFTSLKDIESFVRAESFRTIDVAIDMDINTNIQPIDDPRFDPEVVDFLPQDLEQDIRIMTPEGLAGIDLDPFYAGDQSAVTSGAFGGGGGSGPGGGDTSFPAPEPTPTPPTPTPTPPVPPS